MSRRHTAQQPLDERLGELLAVERRLDAAVKQAKADAEQRLVEARRDGERTRHAAEAREHEQARLEEAEDVAAYDEALARLQAEHAEAMAWLAAVPDALVERLARFAVDCAVRGEVRGGAEGEASAVPGEEKNGGAEAERSAADDSADTVASPPAKTGGAR